MPQRGRAKMASAAYATAIGLAAISTGSLLAIFIPMAAVMAGAFYFIGTVQGERIKETRTDLDSRIATLGTTLTDRIQLLDDDVDRRITDLGARLDLQIPA